MSGSLCVRECPYVFEDVGRRFKRGELNSGMRGPVNMKVTYASQIL